MVPRRRPPRLSARDALRGRGAIASRPEAQNRFTVIADAETGSSAPGSRSAPRSCPARLRAWRSEHHVLDLRRIEARHPPERVADGEGGELSGRVARSVPAGALPTGVRTAETMTASVMAAPFGGDARGPRAISSTWPLNKWFAPRTTASCLGAGRSSKKACMCARGHSSSRSPCTKYFDLTLALTAVKSYMWRAGAVPMSVETRSSRAPAINDTKAPKEKPAVQRSAWGFRAAMKSRPARKSSIRRRRCRTSPALRPTPLKLKRSTAQPSEARAFVLG